MGILYSQRVTLISVLLFITNATAGPVIQVGLDKTDITPQEAMPLWGYSSRTDPFLGVYDPLYCRASKRDRIRKRRYLYVSIRSAVNRKR